MILLFIEVKNNVTSFLLLFVCFLFFKPKFSNMGTGLILPSNHETCKTVFRFENCGINS